MDIETLTNHITNLGKAYFDKACHLVLNKVFGFNAINIDGASDGGRDMISFKEGIGEKVAYQITTQKTDITRKAYNDAKKAIEKLGIEKYYFLSTYNISEVDKVLLEAKISQELKISATCLPPKIIAGLILNDGRLNEFIESIDYPLPRQHGVAIDIKEQALHGYNIFSEDSSSFKDNVYDETILFNLLHNEMSESELTETVIAFLNLTVDPALLKKRIGSLFGREMIKKNDEGNITLTDKSKSDLISRQSLYDIELNNLSAAQTDLLQGKYKIPWTADESRKISIWIANSYISHHLENLKEINAPLINSNFYNISENGNVKLKGFLIKEKKIAPEAVDNIVIELMDMAASHPLINKITRASVYVALNGNNPIASAKALGANRWSDINIIVEPSVALPYICSLLYSGNDDRSFKNCVKSIAQAKSQDSLLYMPYYYINECAGHLQAATRYVAFNDEGEELEYSKNLFISNYFYLKNRGKNVPLTISEYLQTFSTALKFKREDTRQWVRSIMTDIQSLLTQNGIAFIDTPRYEEDELMETKEQLKEIIEEFRIKKKDSLIMNDVYTLKSTNDRIANSGEVWMILSNDKTLIKFAQSHLYKGWIANPVKFLELTELSKPMNESRLVSLVHSVATYSERTLSIGARIIDKLVLMSSKDIQNWELKAEIDKFKAETIASLDINDPDLFTKVDDKTKEFVANHGLNDKKEDEIDNGDIPFES